MSASAALSRTHEDHDASTRAGAARIDPARGDSRLRVGRPLAAGLALLAVLTTGCVTQFRSAAPLATAEARVVAADLAVAGVLARRPGEAGTTEPAAAAALSAESGAPDASAKLSISDLSLLLASPARLRARSEQRRAIEQRVGHRFVLVGEASAAPTDELRSWIVQIVIPIPFIWISFGIPFQYAANANVPHATTSTRIVDLESGAIVAATFQVDAGLPPDQAPTFRRAAAARSVQRMALIRR